MDGSHHQRRDVTVTLTPEIFPDATALGRALAVEIADGIAAATQAGRSYLLGCPTGRTPETVYRALADEVRARRLDLSGLVVVLMDDYVVAGPDGTLRRVPEDLPHSCEWFGRERIVALLERAASEVGGRGGTTLWIPDPAAEPGVYDERIGAAGGIDLFIVASGASDGHIAFNPPGSARDSVTRVIELAETTRRDNLVTFPDFPNLEAVPALGVSVGISTIADLSAAVVMLVHGADKSMSFERLAAAVEYDPDWPATIITQCRNPRLFADAAAASPVTPQPLPFA